MHQITWKELKFIKCLFILIYLYSSDFDLNIDEIDKITYDFEISCISS